MARRARTTQPVVILHGWQGSGPEHWQSWLAARLADGHEVRYPCLPEADEPELRPWLEALWHTLAGLPEAGYDVLCHSLAVPLWLHHVTGTTSLPTPARVILVAPPSPRTGILAGASFFPVPLDVDRVRAGAGGTVLVCSDDDPYCPEGAALAYGRPLRLPVTLLRGTGHLTVDSGYGPWPAVEDWCNRPNLAFPP